MGRRSTGNADRNAGCIGMDLHPQSGRGSATADSHFSAGVIAVLKSVQNGACAKTDTLDDGPEDMVRFMRER